MNNTTRYWRCRVCGNKALSQDMTEDIPKYYIDKMLCEKCVKKELALDEKYKSSYPHWELLTFVQWYGINTNEYPNFQHWQIPSCHKGG